MRHVVAVAGVAGALLIPSSSSPDNARMQREIVRLNHRLCGAELRIYDLAARVSVLEGTAKPTPAGQDALPVCPKP